MDTQSIITTKIGVQKIGRQVSDELPQVKDATVNLRDRVNDILLDKKHILVNYQIAINEAINDDLRNLLIDNRNKIQSTHTIFFNEMFSLGEYQADVATNPQIRDAFDVFSGYKTQLPYKQ
ncbi:spore coat protein [Petroclostridium sp. X23]|uniref:spore coat protein n=1 Tax=Petroclostridium sp. X23 TaxID=3045146 RepID=UPI0024AE86EA|nr:spore coat protein [Petroclostridium sp. X23]WHH61741.1 spore coat protein [Petroclostridium sp. X23]